MSRDPGIIRVLLAGEMGDLAAELDGASCAGKQVAVVGQITTAEELTSRVPELQPDVMLADGDSPDLDALGCIEHLFLHDLPVCCVLLWATQDTAKIRQAMRVGAEDFLLKPVETDKLLEALGTVYGIVCEKFPDGWSAAAPAVKADHVCQVIGVTCGKPGVGKTTMATNLAVAMAHDFQKRVALVDLQFGDVAVALSLRPTRALTELLSLGDEIDVQILADYRVAHNSGVDLYSGFTQPNFRQCQTFDAYSLQTILQVMALQYEYIFVVFPFLTGDDALSALSVVDQVLVVTIPSDLLTLRDTKLFLDAIEGTFVTADKIAVVLNCADKRAHISPEDVEKTLKRPLLARIPNDTDLASSSINLGVPLVIGKPRATVSTELRNLAAALAGVEMTTSNGKGHGLSLFGGR